MALPPYTPTIINSRGGRTRPDNVFISEELINWINKCEVKEDETPPQADHFPITTIINLTIQRSIKDAAWNFRATDWKKFKEELGGALEGRPEPREITEIGEVDETLAELERVVMEVMEKVVPKRKPSPYAKRWWSKELDSLRKAARKAASKARRFLEFPLHSSHEIARTARNEYSEGISIAKIQHWENWLEEISGKTLWDSHKFMTAPAADGSKTRIPALVTKDLRGNDV
ncbi:hypothetical protein BYT27DRAFT_7102615 [Phlegmacium glaucopus]|nr:hypothetical protein BYT27DRAFT_7102615 [Phlegmacium glaucopus]